MSNELVMDSVLPPRGNRSRPVFWQTQVLGDFLEATPQRDAALVNLPVREGQLRAEPILRLFKGTSCSVLQAMPACT